MSVLACDRVGCENIMCDRFSVSHGYVCGDCFIEMLDAQSDGVTFSIKEFMQTPKCADDSAVDLSEEFGVSWLEG